MAVRTPVRIVDNGNVLGTVYSDSAGAMTPRMCFTTSATVGQTFHATASDLSVHTAPAGPAGEAASPTFFSTATPGQHDLCATGVSADGQLTTECAAVDVLGVQLTRTLSGRGLAATSVLPFTGGLRLTAANMTGLVVSVAFLVAVGYLLIMGARLLRRRRRRHRRVHSVA